MEKPRPTRGLHHVALNVTDLPAAERFYVELVGMQVEWRPDDDNVYLTSGNDNLALHRNLEVQTSGVQALDHLGFILDTPEDVDQWYTFLVAKQVPIKAGPRTHRDGARSFYCQDPDGHTVQFIYHPPLFNKF
jgi:catechol 2,3-dioxygenase-like lactoylglutathione lyase family enzyme